MSPIQNSNDTSSDLSRHHGSSAEWDSIWKSYDSDDLGLRKAYTRGAPRSLIQFWQRCYFEDLIHLLAPSSSWEFLELASGRGTTSLYLACNGMTNITLVDLSATALETAKNNFNEEQQQEPVTHLADAEHTELDADRYDCIYNIGVLEHFEDPTNILKEAFRLLKPGGKLFMPIVPEMPFSHSLLCRSVLNPLSIVKHVVKKAIGRETEVHNSMVRTKTSCREYEQHCRTIGFDSVCCVPYNPYWQVNPTGSLTQRFVALPIYRLHYRIRKLIPTKSARLRTLAPLSVCHLLTAEKPSVKRP